MPELCRFYGVRIKMYYDDHNPPHFHAEYAGDEALITIDTLDVMAGELPSPGLRVGLRVGWEAPCGAKRGVEVREKLGADGKDQPTRISQKGATTQRCTGRCRGAL
jgi:hypothetical protein